MQPDGSGQAGAVAQTNGLSTEQWAAFRAEKVPAALAEASRLSLAGSPDRPNEAKYQAAQCLEYCGREAARSGPCPVSWPGKVALG